MKQIALTLAFVTMTAIAAGASTEQWNAIGLRLESGVTPAEACRLIFIYARNGDRVTFAANSAMAPLTAKCNTASTHAFGLLEDDCSVTQFLLGMVHTAVPELTCKSG